MSSVEKIAWGAGGLLSFIVLIVWLRWEGPGRTKRKMSLLRCRKKENAKQRTVDQSSLIIWPSISFARLLRAMARSKRSAHLISANAGMAGIE
jgi:hypothetical protein